MGKRKNRPRRPYHPPKFWLLIVTVILFIFVGITVYTRLNKYQTTGAITLSGLQKKVTVERDENGMAYLFGQDFHDLAMAQGFITAQNRLFQMELIKRAATGRLSELLGQAGRDIDRRHRTIGFLRQARKQARILNRETRTWLENYILGVNAYIRTMTSEHPLEFWLADLTPEPWTIEDSLAIIFLMSWTSAGNLQTEIIAQMLVDKLGYDKALEIFPLNINPDDELTKSSHQSRDIKERHEILNL
ncbi:MAG: penicillin acylase family protein, partial [Deltaproteobacteria bacterium]|nr:penicillin acylase family protein [Deltaproteobacteria bacterium]